MDANQGLQSWKEALGSQIRDARKKAGLSQEALAEAVGKSRQIIGRYESGSDAPSVNVLGKIALKLAMSEVNVNGYRFSVRLQVDSASTETTEQLRLDFDKEHVFPGATLRITPSKVTITITATAPAMSRAS